MGIIFFYLFNFFLVFSFSLFPFSLAFCSLRLCFSRDSYASSSLTFLFFLIKSLFFFIIFFKSIILSFSHFLSIPFSPSFLLYTFFFILQKIIFISVSFLFVSIFFFFFFNFFSLFLFAPTALRAARVNNRIDLDLEERLSFEVIIFVLEYRTGSIDFYSYGQLELLE